MKLGKIQFRKETLRECLVLQVLSKKAPFIRKSVTWSSGVLPRAQVLRSHGNPKTLAFLVPGNLTQKAPRRRGKPTLTG